MKRLLILLLAALTLLTLGCHKTPDAGLRVTVLDVGQGDATLLCAAGKFMLVDTGSAFASEELMRQLEANGVEKLDYLVLTHPHEDHVGNARRVLLEFDVETLIATTAIAVDLGYELILQTARERGAQIRVMRAGDGFWLAEVACTVLWAGEDAEDWNNSSMVLRVAYGETVFLFMGDVEAEVEEALLASVPAELDCDFLHVGHHGSDSSTTAAFLEAATPQLAVVGCGENNSYGFPHMQVRDRLTAVGATLWRTDLDGAVTFESDGTCVRFVGKTRGE